MSKQEASHLWTAARKVLLQLCVNLRFAVRSYVISFWTILVYGPDIVRNAGISFFKKQFLYYFNCLDNNKFCSN